MAIHREKILESAQKYIEKRKYDKAIDELRRVVAADPNDARTLHKIGELQLKLGLVVEAIDTFDAVGKLYTTGGFAQKAVAVYRQILDIIASQAPQVEDRFGHVAPRLADLYAELGLKTEALSVLEAVGKRFEARGRQADALEVFRRIAQIDTTSALSQLRLAEGLSRVRDVEGAVAAFRMASAILREADRRDDAIQVLERLLFHAPIPEDARVCAELYIARNRSNDVTQALAKLQICFQANPNDIDTLGLIARSFDMIGQSAKSIEVQKQMAKIARDSGRSDVFRDLVMHLVRVAPADPAVRELVRQVS